MTDTLPALIIVAVAWIGLRWHNGASFRPTLSLLLDATIAAWCWAVVSLASDRLLLGAIVTGFGAIGLAIADDAKFAALRERLAFSDRAELLEVVRHPGMYLPFAGTGIVLSGAAACVLFVAVLEWYEPPMLPHWWLAPPLLIALGALYFSLAIPQLLSFLAWLFASWSPSGVPDSDIPRFGLLACFVIHASLARFEREARRAPHRVAHIFQPLALTAARSIIVVQFESFFDLNRLDGAYGASSPNLLRLQRAAAYFGSFDVPCWGANTIRTEFAALTGIDVRQIGLDQYNPYERFARQQVDSLAWDMQSRGLESLCIHPFDLNFYGRSQVMPKLGFERLIGPEAFDRSMGRGYVTDQAIVERIALELDAARNTGKPSLVFAITIAAHGPWQESQAADSGEAAGVRAYIAAAGLMDEALLQLRSLADEHDAILAIYGDHQPSLPKTFSAVGFRDPRTDYVIYDPRANNPAVTADTRRDLAAHELRRRILQVFDRELVRDDPVVIAE